MVLLADVKLFQAPLELHQQLSPQLRLKVLQKLILRNRSIYSVLELEFDLPGGEHNLQTLLDEHGTAFFCQVYTDEYFIQALHAGYHQLVVSFSHLWVHYTKRFSYGELSEIIQYNNEAMALFAFEHREDDFFDDRGYMVIKAIRYRMLELTNRFLDHPDLIDSARWYRKRPNIISHAMRTLPSLIPRLAEHPAPGLNGEYITDAVDSELPTDTIAILLNTPRIMSHLKRDNINDALINAIKVNRADVVELLVTHSADVNYSDDVVALIHAVKLDNLIMVKCLVDHKANVNASSRAFRRSKNITVLEHAYYRDHADIIRYLVDHGASQ